MAAAAPVARQPINALTVDVEDYFQVSAFEDQVSRASWDRYESRVVRNTERLLEMFDAAGVKATFFVLGWVGDRFPSLVRQIASLGHEVASHSHEHRLVYSQTPAEFRDDLRRARAILEAAAGHRVLGYRAPSYSVTRQSLWAFDVLIEEGYLYDASVYPIRHDRYGIPDWPRHPHRVQRAGASIWEFPSMTVRVGGINLPAGGGGYFRLLPYWWTTFSFRRMNDVERQPGMFYLHPWEVDPEQPRLNGSALSRFRHYRNLAATEPRLRALLAEVRFGRVIDIIAAQEEQPHAAVSRVAAMT